MDRETWRTESNGLVSEVLGLKLIVRQSGAFARYIILQAQGGSGTCAQAMLSSGTEATVNAAMMTAERVAKRTALVLGERRRSVIQLERRAVVNGESEMEW